MRKRVYVPRVSLLLLAASLHLLPACGFLRYGLTQGRIGNLSKGDVAPNPELRTLDGSAAHLMDFVGERPLVLVFGSFT